MTQITSIEIELGSKCNLHCPLCTRNKKFYDNKHEKFQQELNVKSLIRFLDTMKPKDIKLVGAICEPTLYKHFLKVLNYCKDHNITIWLSTNGSTKNEEFWRQVARDIPEHSTINFDIDHTDPIKQLTYRRGSNLNKIISNIKVVQEELLILNKKVKLCALRIDFDWNKDNYKEFLYTAENIWKVEVYNIPCYNYSQDEFNELVEFWSHPKQVMYNRLDKLDKTKFSMKQDITCEAKNTTSIYLNCLGDIIPCCYINDLILKEDISLYMTDKSIRSGFNFPRFLSIYTNPSKEDIYNNYFNIISEGERQEDNNDLCSCCQKFCSKNKRKMFKVMDLDP